VAIRYIPNATQVVVGIQHGWVLFCWHGSVNDEGNIGRMTPSWSPNDLKILVVGDSFSARNGCSHPSHRDTHLTCDLPKI
jgi:hypothetical protein